MSRTPKPEPGWAQVKARLTTLDQAALMVLIRDLHDASKENRIFLHSRLGLTADPLKHYKEAVDRWMWPDVLRREMPSAAKAKQAIADYRKAIGDPRDLAELMVFFCERGTGFSADVGFDNESFLNALWRMFEQAMKVVKGLPEKERVPFLTRLHKVQEKSKRLSYGICDIMADLLASR